MTRIGPLRKVPCPACRKPMPPIRVSVRTVGLKPLQVAVEPVIDEGWSRAFTEQHPGCVIEADGG